MKLLRDGVALYTEDEHTGSQLVVRLALGTISMDVRLVGMLCGEHRACVVNRWSSKIAVQHAYYVVNLNHML